MEKVNVEQLNRMNSGKGFIAALDQKRRQYTKGIIAIWC